MRRPRPRHNTTSLPRNLRAELGIKDHYGERKNKRNGPATRKDQRRAERAEKKGKRGPPSKSSGRRSREDEEEDDDDDDDDDEDLAGLEDGSDFDVDLAESDEDDVAPPKSKKAKTETKPKSILKKTKEVQQSDSEDDEDEVEKRPRKVSSAVQEKLNEDDAEIAALEKKLGLKKGKKLPKSFEEDGLLDLLGEIDDESADESRKRKREADEWLQKKRRKAQGLEVEEDSEEDDSDLGSDEDMEDFDEEDMFDESDEDEDEEGDTGEDEKPAKKRENPYVAPVAQSAENKPAKYIPPSLRAASTSESESLTRLRRQAQGQLNKLSEANLVSILNEFEKLYREYPRQNVTSTLLTLLFGLVCERSALQDTFVILHAGFIAALYKVIGMDFGAELVQKLVEYFDAAGDERDKFQGKEMINLISLLSQLYNFHVVSSTLVFDYIRLFLQDINEENTELLLKVIRNSGPQLRQDDPSSLKDIVLLIQPAVAKIGEEALSVRTKFMIDTITDLKNNRLKSAPGSTIASEHITKMRKILGSLNNSRVLRATEPISISREDIHNASKKGKWWLVGASWKEDPLVSARQELANLPLDNKQAVPDDDSEGEPDLASIAKAHRMNTDIRRSIFVAIMSATDYQDAHVRLLKLRLKRTQEYEIPRVLTHCAMEEEAYNPYYTLIGRRLCGEMGRRMKVSFMYTLWNAFKRMGEAGDMDDDSDGGFGEDEADERNKLQMKSIVNLAKMYGSLIADNALTLSVLKTLNFAYVQPKTKAFLEILFISIIQQSQKSKRSKKKSKKTDGEEEAARDEKPLIEIFMRTRDTPQIVKGLIFFVRKVVSKTDLVESEKDRKLVKWGCSVALDALRVVANEDGGLP
ncbi:MIF4G domain-containing protein [Aspergillus clavatus NRRL 1]|uniref:Nuclear protein (Sgd1), putative n=1 Tax=Aspergillus clavatus (strain ATCC 1007 / CBS 513.65 / DSM 816 / NCTC 3887 / NRRL 1 / QM 1276 / 107) TaxID=344612 RepID=A1CFD7_ASPCL|nr:nuclear protein (Sgd1), putative [Aspergillus clavatus NRRL 1]EAW11586.1 nuclear protein (Sgd1), putative [Aspergillus clavatus NRRL 1]